jgi:hypothetical protein
MSPAIVDSQHLDVHVVMTAVDVLVFDAHVGEMHLVIEVRKVVLVSPFLDLVRLAIGPAVSLLVVAIPFVQPALVLTLELVVEHDAIDPRLAVGELLRFAQIGLIDLRIVLDLARLHEARVELLPVVLMMVVTMEVQEIAATVGKNDDVVTVTIQPLRSDEPLFPQVTEVARPRIGRAAVVVAEVTGGYDAERTYR